MDLIELVPAKVKDDSGRLTEIDDYQPAIEAALGLYSSHRPRRVVDDVAGAGTHDVALPADWLEEFSQALAVEYPVGQVPAAMIDAADWTIYQAPGGPVLRLAAIEPGASESVRLTYTLPRTEAQIKSGDADAVACLAASFCCDTLANLYANTSDPTISADVVNYRSKSAEYARRAKDLRRLYAERMGLDADGGAPAASTVARPPEGGWTLTHGRR